MKSDNREAKLDAMIERLRNMQVEKFRPYCRPEILGILVTRRMVSNEYCIELERNGLNSWERQVLWMFADDKYKVNKVKYCLTQVAQLPDSTIAETYDEFILRQGAQFLLTLIDESKL